MTKHQIINSFTPFYFDFPSFLGPFLYLPSPISTFQLKSWPSWCQVLWLAVYFVKISIGFRSETKDNDSLINLQKLQK